MSTDTSDPNKPWIVTIGFDAPENPTSSTPTSLKESVVKVNDEQEEKEHREFTEMLEKLEASDRSTPQSTAPIDSSTPKKEEVPIENKMKSTSSSNLTPPANPLGTSGSFRKLKPEDFTFGQVVGEGSFGQVKVCTEIATGVTWAAKLLDKKHIVKLGKAETVQREKQIMDSLKHPNIVQLYCTFQDAEHLYFILEYCPNGELLDLIKKAGRFDERGTKFYAAELILAVEHMHSLGILHRDIKPENILLDPTMHSKLSDFGTSQKIGNEKDARVANFAGTPEYVSPELVIDKWAGKISDIWAIGCVIYQMLVGKPPFKGETEYLTFKAIQANDYKIAEYLSPTSVSLIKGLLNPDPTQRLGANGFDEIKAHPFFSDLNFATLTQQTPPKIQHIRTSKQLANSRKITTERENQLKAQKSSEWAKFLFDNELIIHDGLVWKKKQLRVPRKRQLILTDLPRLIYIDALKMQQKGEITWESPDQISIKCQNEKRFTIKAAHRTYFLQEIKGNSTKWYDSLTKILEEQRHQ